MVTVGGTGAYAASNGTFNMGNASGTLASLGLTGNIGGSRVADLVIRAHDATNGNALSGTSPGCGTVGLDGALINNGVVRADGYGIDQTLDMSSFASVNLSGVATFANQGGQGGSLRTTASCSCPPSKPRPPAATIGAATQRRSTWLTASG